MADSIEQIKSKRSRAKAALTRITKSLVRLELFGKVDVEIRIDKLEQAYSNFEFADAKQPIEMSEIEEFKEKYFETIGKLHTHSENVNMPMQMNNADIMCVNNIFKAGKSGDNRSSNSAFIKCPK
ncbi:hypothetical protein AVEN_100459-1 [Araneus ventricosus]|uniref:Uncharacterized protein n=1 Tax=Araneus ventricosus TaxID=182803 RepID=A0A4Y2MG03_ARAVE|nr:hypothetical protein AVEN_100459-1 [Araneus ventricosus]